MIFSRFIVNTYKTNHNYYEINRKNKLIALKQILKFLNSGINLKEQGYFSNNIIEGNLDNLTFAQKESLLIHLEDCHEKINKNLYSNCEKNYDELLKKTVNLFRNLKTFESDTIIKNMAEQFLFLMSHRDGNYHNNYARTADNFRLFLSNNLSYNNILNDWVKVSSDTSNYANYIEAKNRIINCINNLDTKLDLSNLKIWGIPKTIYSKLTHIKILKLNNNYIESLDPEIKKLVDLEELDLSYNFITNDHYSDINGLLKLRKVNLSNNHITSIESDTFNNLPNLTELKLSGDNVINTIPEDAFDENIRARVLNKSLNHNTYNIYTIYFASFNINSLENILNKWVEDNNTTANYLKAKLLIMNCINEYNQSLDLSNLGLNNLPPDIVFSALKQVEELNLSDNKIKTIKDDIFISLTNLKELYINNNLIQEINFSIFDHLNKFQFFNNLIEENS